MLEKNRPIKFPPLSTISFLTIICLILTFLTDDLLFSLLTGGKDLEGRNQSLQLIFVVIYFIILVSLSLIIFHIHVSRLLTQPFPLYCLIALAPLAAHAYVGSFSRFVADDFSSAALTVEKGILGATWDWYTNWSGRFSASFFDSLAGFTGPSSMKYAMGISLLLLISGMVLFSTRILQGSNRQNALTGLFLSSLVLTSAFFITPDLPQSLYWGQGMRSLILPLIPLFFILAILKDIDKGQKPKTSWIVVIAVLSFFAGGFGETYVVIQTTVFGLLILFLCMQKPFGFRKQKLLAPLIAMVSSIAAMVVTVLAPGNRVRQGYFPPPPSPVALASIAFESMGKFFDAIFHSPELSSCLAFVSVVALIFGCLYAIRNNVKDSDQIMYFSSNRIPEILFLAIIACSFFLLIFVSFLPSAYAMSTTPPPRTLVLPSLILCIALVALGFIAGLMVGSSLIPRGLSQVLRNSWVSLLAAVILAACSYQVSSRILTVVPDYRFFAERFDRADQMIRKAKSAGEKSVTVPEVHNHYGLSDYGEGTTYWLDDAVDRYYGLHVIINKHMK